MNKDIQLIPYSDKSFVLRGELTKQYKEAIKGLGGSWNPKLKGGPGWIFSNRKLDQVNFWVGQINDGKIQSDPQPIKSIDYTSVYTPSTSTSTNQQFVQWKVDIPRGDNIFITVNNITYSLPIIKIEDHQGIKDTVIFRQNNNESKAVIINGQWQIFGYVIEHTISFK